jgi:Tol biopolymer transport system component
MKYTKKIFYRGLLIALLVSLFTFGIFGFLDRQTASAQAAPGIIAYVRPSTNDIHLISPDGTGDRVLWTAPDTDGVWPAYDLAWRPDGGELAFSSQHEETCSVYQSDVYAIGYYGTGYRRVTNSPACAVLATLPKGSVEVDVSNYMGLQAKAYVQGAPGIQPVPDGYSKVTFNDVADLGAGVLQPPIGLYGFYRFMPSGPLPDVQPGATVYGGNLIIFSVSNGADSFGTGKISWKADGSALGYGMRTYSGIRQIPANPPYGSAGVDLPVVTDSETGLVAWGPTPALKDKYLYYAQADLLGPPDIEGIYLNTVGDTSGGTKLVPLDNWTGPHIYDIEWLPDGSGFLFSENYVNFEIYTDIFEYNFTTQEITQLTPSLLDESGDGGARGLSISPDGQQIVFERAVYPFETPSSLWIMNSDGSGLHKLADDAARPAWGQTPSFPAPAIKGLNPSSTTAGSSAFTLTVNGTGFVSGSVVRWNGSDRATTYVNDTQLTASIPATVIAAAGSASITVFNPAPGGGTSNAASISINNPAPTITSLNPSSIIPGGSAFTLTVNGTGFVSGSVVRWNGSDRATTYVNATKLTASISAADIATAGSASVTVFNPAPGGGTSNTTAFGAVIYHYIYLPAILR